MYVGHIQKPRKHCLWVSGASQQQQNVSLILHCNLQKEAKAEAAEKQAAMVTETLKSSESTIQYMEEDRSPRAASRERRGDGRRHGDSIRRRQEDDHDNRRHGYLDDRAVNTNTRVDDSKRRRYDHDLQDETPGRRHGLDRGRLTSSPERQGIDKDDRQYDLHGRRRDDYRSRRDAAMDSDLREDRVAQQQGQHGASPLRKGDDYRRRQDAAMDSDLREDRVAQQQGQHGASPFRQAHVELHSWSNQTDGGLHFQSKQQGSDLLRHTACDDNASIPAGHCQHQEEYVEGVPLRSQLDDSIGSARAEHSHRAEVSGKTFYSPRWCSFELDSET